MSTHYFQITYLSAYASGYSTESVLLRLQNDLLSVMDRQEETAVAALGLSAASNTVDHPVLLQVLNTRFGISGKALEWLDTYLKSRTNTSWKSSFH